MRQRKAVKKDIRGSDGPFMVFDSSLSFCCYSVTFAEAGCMYKLALERGRDSRDLGTRSAEYSVENRL